MKAKFLSIALILGAASSSFANTSNNSSFVITMETTQNDGYKVVEVKDLSEEVQKAITALEENFTIEQVAFNEELSLTKVNVISKADESKKEIILDKEGKEILPVVAEIKEEVKENDGTPSIYFEEAIQNDGYKVVEVKDLSEEVQKAITALEENFTIEQVAFNEELSLTKVNVISKADESKKEIILDKEGNEVVPAVEEVK